MYLKEVSKNDALEAEVDAEVDADIEAVAGVDTESDSLQDPHTQFTDFDFANASASLNAEAPSAADFVPVGPIPNSTGIPNLSAADIGDNDSFLNEYQIMGLGLSEGLPPMEMMEELYVVTKAPSFANVCLRNPPL